MTEPAHSLLGASSAYRWLNCPGSFKLSQSAPHRPSSIYAATGTLAHEFIEGQVSTAGFSRMPVRELGQTYQRDGHTIIVDRELIDGVNRMLDYLFDVAVSADWVDVEFRVDLSTYFPEPPPVPVFGTVDAAALTPPVLEIIDYKNGAGITVTPVENPQLMFYAAGVLALLRSDLREQVQRLKLTVVQPHALGVPPVRSWEISAVDLLMWVDEVLVPGVAHCARDDAPLVPGDWCRFCPVVHACPQLHRDAVAMAKCEFDGTEIVPNDLAVALETAERAELWIARLREFAVDQLEHQVRIPGWGLVPTRATRQWLAPDSDIADKLQELGATHDEVWETRVRSPAQIEKQLNRTRKGKRVWDMARSLAEARSSGVKLGRDNSTNAREDFTDE